MQLRTGIVEHQPEPMLSGEVECDEVYVIAGHKGHPGAVKKNDAGVGGGGSRGRVDVARSRRNGRLLVVAAFLAATASRDLAGEVTALLRLLSVRPQYTDSRKRADDSAVGTAQQLVDSPEPILSLEP